MVPFARALISSHLGCHAANWPQLAMQSFGGAVGIPLFGGNRGVVGGPTPFTCSDSIRAFCHNTYITDNRPTMDRIAQQRLDVNGGPNIVGMEG